jgi:hypothetical protein
MTKIEQVISSIESLSEQEFAKLRDWIIERDWERWDSQIERDSEIGRLNFLVEEAFDEKEKGKLKEI